MISVLLLASSTPADAAEPPHRFKILTELEGIHRLTYEDLEAAGLVEPTTDSLALTNRGITVPLWRRDTDGRFGPGDDILFHAEHLSGEHSYYHDYSRYNVYFLTVGAPGAELAVASTGNATSPPESVARPLGRQHLERDRLLMRFSHASEGDAWFWRRLTQIDPQPFRQALDLTDLDPRGPARLRVALRGWSRPLRRSDPPLPDHLVELSLNGTAVASIAWQAQEEAILEAEIDPSILRRGRNWLELRVPQRTAPNEAEPLIDVALLNWIDIEYPRRGMVAGDRQDTLIVPDQPGASRLLARTDIPRRLLVFSDRTVHRWRAPGDRTEHPIDLPASVSGRLTVVPDDAFLEPVVVLPDESSSLRSESQRADYLMIAHPRLASAVEPLAELHRRRGLEVEVISVFDIYDEFNHGIVHPRAIRDFVAFTHRRWGRPAPRFVLLVGDASWDVKNERPNPGNYADWTYLPGEVRRSRRNQMTPYEETTAGDRNLVPTWSYHGSQGHAASDNYFVAVEGDDHLPDLAIGRLAVATPEEVAAIVAKTTRYATSDSVGPWRRSILWISNENPGFQKRSDRLARAMLEHGFDAETIYPAPDEADNRAHQEALLEALDGGQLLVHFLGHGGRYIWRTGPPDFRKNHDLFTLDHLDRLRPTDRLPVILSMTCYSAPFDHPTADSIGEKFLRLADRGAVAVLAASWRNSPTQEFSAAVLEELIESESLGEAVLAAKRRIGRRDLIETYNLLGDPALPLRRPGKHLAVSPIAAPGPARVRIEVLAPTSSHGELLVEWRDRDGAVLAKERRTIETGSSEARFPAGATGEPARVVAYYWEAESGRDAIASLDLTSAAEARSTSP